MAVAVPPAGGLRAQEPAGGGTPAGREDLPAGATVLDVPYFPQTELLCGGAAAAMVLRYWGMVGVRAEDFADLVSRTRGGMRADELGSRIRQLGWEALAFTGGFLEARRHLRLGRPIIALLEVDPGRFHYVVFVGEAGDRLILHDPAGAPYRLMDREDLERAWGPTGYLGLLVLPPPDRATNVRPPASRARPDRAPDTGRDELPAACGRRLDRALSAAAGGRLGEADDLLANGPCANRPAVLRELAGVRLRRGRTAEAAALARRALAERPGDAHAARTLATALYVQDLRGPALDAWNRADEPIVDLVRIAGLDRVNYRPAARLIGLAGGELLTVRGLELARRRLASMPAAALTRIDYAPTGGGRADVVAALVERPGLPDAPIPVAATGLRAAIRREIALTATSPLGRGETWTGAWRWWEHRPAVSFELSAPAEVGPPAVWTLTAGWERETYGLAGDPVDPRPRTARAGVRLDGSWWITPALRAAPRVGYDRWRDAGGALRGGAEVEARAAADRLRLTVEADHWFGRGDGPSFAGAGARMEASTRATPDGLVATARAYVRTVGARAPRTSWPGAGTGIAREELLRAHPLLDGGIVTGPAFDRNLAGGGLELVRWLPVGSVLRIGPAGFVDAARAWGARPGDTWVDAGIGLRLTTAGGGPVLRLDAATGLSDDEWAISVGWAAGD